MKAKASVARLVLGSMGLVSAALLVPATPLLAAPTPAPLSAEDAAIIKLNAARRAFNEKNYPVAAAGFKEFLASNGGSHEAPGAWYGLGLCIVMLPNPDFTAAAEAFNHAVQQQDFSDRPLAQYYLGTALRGLGNRALADAVAKPGEAEALRRTAAQRFTEASVQFAAAQASFDKRVNEAAPPAPAPLPLDMEWSARARCDGAEMLLRIGKFKEAADASILFQTDPALNRSRYRQLGLYHLGYAQFALHDYQSAGRSLSQLAPFAQDFGLHARYLLARVHHLSDERPEAAALYKAVLDEFDVRKKAAEKSLGDQAIDAEHRALLDAIVHGPVPDYVARSRFYGAVLTYEDGRYADAATVFTAIITADANGALTPESRLRLGFCLLQQKQYANAMTALDAVKDNKELNDRALWWGARAKVGTANTANPQEYLNVVNQAVDMLRRAAARAQEMSAADPDAKPRRADILLELGDTQQLAKQYKEAAATYQQIIAEDAKSDRAQEAMQRKVTALHLAGLFKESDAAAEQFIAAYPKSTLLPAVLFRQAENAYLTALAAADVKEPRPREEQEKLFVAAIDRYERVLSKYPEFEYGDLARQALGICNSRIGQYSKAIAAFSAIAEANRTGDLKMVPYLLADCEIRTLAPEADDALSAERLIETAENAAKDLEAFVGAQPKAPQTPDAMLKLGYCYQRIAGQIAASEERTKMLTKAKEVYDRASQQFPGDPAQLTLAFERGKVLAEMNDANGAQVDFARFMNDPYHHAPNAPLALMRLSALQRAMGEPQTSLQTMKRCHDDFETALAADPIRSAWIPMLHYENGLAFQDAHKLPEARAIFADIIKTFPGKPAAVNAQWRLAQCQRLETSEKLAEARAVAAKAGVNPTEVVNAYAACDPSIKLLAQAAEALRVAADAQAVTAANSEPTLRMIYELAWCYRIAGEAEFDAARMKLEHDAAEKVRANWPKDLPTPPAVLATPQLPPGGVAIQPLQQKARECYQRVIFAGPATTLASQARFEMAELLSERGEYDAALDLMATALENQPPKDLTQRIKIRVAAALIAKGNADSAIAQLKPILAEKETPVAAEARYLSGEAAIVQKDWPKAIEAFVPFRDQDPFRNAPDVADRALLRLGYAYAQAKQWEPSRQTYETLVGRFPQSPWLNDARFGMGWAMQNQQHYDQAVNVYSDLRNRTAAEPAAQAMLNLGVCKLEQKHPEDALKLLLSVPMTYDYPDTTAGALYQAARAQADIKQPEEAAKLWKRVIKEYPTTAWAPLAQQKLAELK